MALSYAGTQYGLGQLEQDVTTAVNNAQSALNQAESAVAISNENASQIAALEESGGSGGGSGGGGDIVLTLNTTTVAANQVIDSIDITTVRTVKYTIEAEAQTGGTMAFSAIELLVIQDGTNAYLTSYGAIDNGQGQQGTFNVVINGGNLVLTVTPVNAVTTYKADRNAIAS